MAVTLKVATLIIKALIKPLSNQLKQAAANPGPLRTAFFNFGQFHNKVMIHIQLRSTGHHVKSIKPLMEDEAVKQGADTISEALVLTVGLVAIAAEVYRKTMADRTAAIDKELAMIEKSRAREMRAIEAEDALRSRLLALEERLIGVEDSKIASVHDKLVREQLGHIALTEHLVERIEALEARAKIPSAAPGAVLTAPKGSVCKHILLPQPLAAVQHKPSAIAAAVAAVSPADAGAEAGGEHGAADVTHIAVYPQHMHKHDELDHSNSNGHSNGHGHGHDQGAHSSAAAAGAHGHAAAGSEQTAVLALAGGAPPAATLAHGSAVNALNASPVPVHASHTAAVAHP